MVTVKDLLTAIEKRKDILNDPYVENIHDELDTLERENDRLRITCFVLLVALVVSIVVQGRGSSEAERLAPSQEEVGSNPTPGSN